MRIVLALSLALASLNAYADLQTVANDIVNVPNATYSVDTKNINSPVTITVKSAKGTATADATAEDFAAAVRALVPAKQIVSGDYTYVTGWELLNTTVNGKTVNVYDIVDDIKGVEYDPSYGPVASSEGFIEENYRVLSAVGPFLSFASNGDSYGPGAAHPNGWDSFSTVDVRKLAVPAGGAPYLLDMVDEVSLVKALQKDRVLNRLLKKEADALKAFHAASNMSQLEDALFNGLGESCYEFPAYGASFSSFAVYDYNSSTNLVAIRIPLEAGAHACEAEAPTLQLGVEVTPIGEFASLLKAQAAKKDGLLMKNAK